MRTAWRLAALVAAVLLGGVGVLPAAAAAAAAATAAAAAADTSAGSSTVLAARAPLGPYAGFLSFTVDRITPALVDPAEATVTLSGTLTNTSDQSLRSVVARIQRGEPFTSPAQLQRQLAEPAQPASTWSTFSDVVAEVPPHGTAPFTVSAAAFGQRNESLAVDKTGVYPLLVNFNAEFDDGPADGARVGELYALMTVVGTPAAVDASATPAGADALQGTASALPPGTPGGVAQQLSVVIPLVDRPHRDPSGAFFDDDLVPLISAGGRLDGALRAAESSALPDAAITVAVDPELLEELDLMTAGYFVGATAVELTTPTGTPPAEETPATPPLPTATTLTDVGTPAAALPSSAPLPGPNAVAGTGATVAAEFLDRLRRLSDRVSTLVLPYADLDAVAVVRHGHAAELGTAVSAGRDLARGVLGSTAKLVTDVAWPIDGEVDDATLAALRSAGLTTALLDRSNVVGSPDGTTGNSDTGTGSSPVGTTTWMDTSAGKVTALLATRDVPVGAVGLNTFTAVLAQNYFSRISRPAVYAGGRDTAPTDAYPQLTDLLARMAAAGIVSGGSLQTAGTPDGSASLTYPDVARAAELGAPTFAAIDAGVDQLRALQSAFTPASALDPGTDTGSVAPGDLFAPLLSGMIRQAAGGYRTAPEAAAISLSVVPSVVRTVHSAVTLTPPAGTYTLTSSSSPLVVFIRNDLSYDVHLRVEVDPDDARRAGMQVQDVGVQTFPAGTSRQVLLPAEVNRAGAFTLAVQLTTEDGTEWGPRQTLQMKSTAYGAFTIILIVVAAAVVVLSAGLRIRTRYKDRQARIAAGLQ